ncbi:MAG: aminotransferase class I/II-fold pyridoxal phosphate-dependent enzyme [Spirosomataceae bacterium]
MNYNRMSIEIESPEELGYDTIHYNLAESSVTDFRWEDLSLDLNGLMVSYGEHRGKQALRALIASDSPGLAAQHVLTTTGAAMALFVVATTLLSANDHLVVVRPNYSTNLETPRAIGCALTIIDLPFENGYRFDLAQVEQALQPHTKLISITNPHNPTGVVVEETLIEQLVALAEARGIYLLVDETYRDLNFQTPLRPYVAARSPQVISVCSLSKAFGVPGIRTGWLLCKDDTLMTNLLAAKEQITITNSVIDEEIAYQLLLRKEEILGSIHAQIRQNFAVLKAWFARQPYLDWVEPQAGVVCFPRLKAGYQLDAEAFYHSLYHDYHTLVGPGHWFEQAPTSFRLGFGYSPTDNFTEGLRRLEECLGRWVKEHW